MATGITVTAHLDAAAIAGLSLPGGMVYQAVNHAADTVADRARQFVYSPFDRVDTGFMGDSIHAEMQPTTPEGPWALVGSDADYDIYQHEGTSRGIEGAPFMTEALDSLTVDDYYA